MFQVVSVFLTLVFHTVVYGDVFKVWWHIYISNVRKVL